jgi:hypothetical protein
MREIIGTVLIFAGVLAWPIGLALNLRPAPDILIPHLMLVVPGVYLRGSKILRRIRRV